MLKLNLLILPQEPLSLLEGALKSSLPREQPACPKPNRQQERKENRQFHGRERIKRAKN